MLASIMTVTMALVQTVQASDITVKVKNEITGGSCYLPCICWQGQADEAAQWQQGDTVELLGRYQSRQYEKVLDTATGEREQHYLESAIKGRCLLSGQHSLRRTTEKFGKTNRVLYTIHQEKSILEVCRCVCGQCLRAPREESARIPKDAERLPKR